jgi:homoserine dehydrogenase
VDVVIELIDDPEAAYDIVKAALQKGKAVVTANKKMVADNLTELFELQQKHHAPLLYEASSCASIPIIRNLEEYYDNDLLSAVEGIFNGSTNYILTKIFEERMSFGAALAEAQDRWDTLKQIRHLMSQGSMPSTNCASSSRMPSGLFVEPDDVFNYGIQNISDFDIKIAREKGYTRSN